MYIGKRFLIMLVVVITWLVAVVLPILYAKNGPYMWNGINAILFLTPVAWVVLFGLISLIQRKDDLSQRLHLEQMLRDLNQRDLDQLRQRLSDDPDMELYESIEDLLATQKRKNR